MPVPACIPCGRFYRAHKTGAYVVESMPEGHRVPPGKAHAAEWADYKLWMCDLWRCEGCGSVIASGWGQNPVSEHYEPEFNDWREEATKVMGGALPRIYDC